MLSESLMPMRATIFVRALVLAFFTGLLGGCGEDKSSSGGTAKSESLRGVIASASDCSSFGAEAVTACSDAIANAVTQHEAASATYNNIDTCEAAVGESKCERAASGKYRQRLSAFLVSIGQEAHAEPLYPAQDGAVGFQSADKSQYLASDRSVSFSRLALSVAEAEGTTGKSGPRS